jgi:hypothetical protein
MRKNIVGLLAVALLWGCGIAAATPIVYNVNLSDGIETVTGTITTDGHTGALLAGDITAWTFSASGPLNFLVSSTLFGALVDCGPSCGLSATASSLTYDFSSATAHSLLATVIADDVTGIIFGPGVVSVCFHCPMLPNHFMPFQGLQTIGRAIHVDVPEPATITLLGLALAGLGFSRRRRSN